MGMALAESAFFGPQAEERGLRLFIVLYKYQ